jgi:hypothetical protein
LRVDAPRAIGNLNLSTFFVLTYRNATPLTWSRMPLLITLPLNYHFPRWNLLRPPLGGIVCSDARESPKTPMPALSGGTWVAIWTRPTVRPQASQNGQPSKLRSSLLFSLLPFPGTLAHDPRVVLAASYKAPRLPIVFCHGLFGFDTLGPASLPGLQVSYWRGVREAFEAIGVEVLITRVPASASIEERAKILCERIEEKMKGREINIIGHSMGGEFSLYDQKCHI